MTIQSRIRDYMDRAGTRHTKVAIVPDDLFYEARQEAWKHDEEVLGVYHRRKSDRLLPVLVDLETQIITQYMANKALHEKYATKPANY